MSRVPPDADLTVLLVRVVDDPQVRRGFPRRKPEVRLRMALKELLRKYGVKVVRYGDDPARLHEFILSLAERVHVQSESLAKRAEKKK